MRRITPYLLAVLVTLFAASAQAQLAGLNHVLTAPGALNSASGLGTYVSCTNGNTSTPTIGVEAWSAAGTYLGGQAVPMAPFATVMWGTRSSVGVGEDINLALPDFKGHMRIVASTGGKIVCSAFVADALTFQPNAMLSLPVVK